MPETTYIPRPDATPESEISALAAVYEFVLRKKAAGRLPSPDDRDDAKESKNGVATGSLP